MKHVADTMKGPLYRHLGHFGQAKNLKAGHNTSEVMGQQQNPNARTSLPPHPEPNFPLTPTERNQINNIEKGSGAAHPSGSDVSPQNQKDI